MELFKIKKDIPFMKNALVFNAISFITFALAVFFLFSRGLHLSVEFTGGTLMEVSYSQPADLNKVRTTVGTLGFSEVQVQNFGTARDVMNTAISRALTVFLRIMTFSVNDEIFYDHAVTKQPIIFKSPEIR